MNNTSNQPTTANYEDPEESWDGEILSALGMDGAEFGIYGDTVVCKHGIEIEMDGSCGQGCGPLI